MMRIRDQLSALKSGDELRVVVLRAGKIIEMKGVVR
jgi:hypothetical protein